MATPKNLEQQLRRDEGERLSAYQDSLGYWTIGIGRLIDGRKGGGISSEEASYLFANDVKRIKGDLVKLVPWFYKLDEVRQGVLLNMAFQMGASGVAGFENTLKMVEAGNYAGAAAGMLQSVWARQTPNRAQRLSEQMRTGKWQ